MASNKQRIGIIELWRFVFSLAIVAFHWQVKSWTIPLFQESGWIYVEFFFMLTGYFTAWHFWQGKLPESADSIAFPGGVMEAVRYPLYKFRRMMPYIALGVLTDTLIVYANAINGKRDLATAIERVLCNLLLLSTSGITQVLDPPIWYLSAIFLMLPPVCFLLVCKGVRILYIYYFSWLLPVLYYGKAGIVARAEWPSDLMRAFCAMSLGVFTYVLSVQLGRMQVKRWGKFLLGMLEVGCFAVTLCLTAYNMENYALIILLFIVGLSIMMSGVSSTAIIQGCVCDFLGKLSLVIFLFHYLVLEIVRNNINRFSDNRQAAMWYYALSVLISIVVYYLVYFGEKICKNVFVVLNDKYLEGNKSE